MFIERDLRELSNVSSHHFPDRSTKWLLRQREHLQALLKMVASEIVDSLDFGRVEQVNRSFISDELRTQESDMVFRVPFRSPTETCEELIVYLLIEHQSTVDPAMALRLLSYMTQIWMEERRQWIETGHPKAEWRLTPIVPIVFYTGTGAWRTPLSLTASWTSRKSSHASSRPSTPCSSMSKPQPLTNLHRRGTLSVGY